MSLVEIPVQENRNQWNRWCVDHRFIEGLSIYTDLPWYCQRCWESDRQFVEFRTLYLDHYGPPIARLCLPCSSLYDPETRLIPQVTEEEMAWRLLRGSA